MTKGDKLMKKYHESTPLTLEEIKRIEEEWSKPGALIPVSNISQVFTGTYSIKSGQPP